MKKSYVILIAIVAFLFAIAGWIIGNYNSLVAMDEETNGKWSNVETAYQRRADLIPNLVNTVKGYAEFEKETLTGVIEARSKATGINLTADDLTPENLSKFQAAQDQLSGALSRLLVSVERYPELKANENFLSLQKQLEGTENRIAMERNNFNASIKTYNASIRKFPKVIIASMMGFEKKNYFEAEEAAAQAPAVGF